MNLIKNCRDLGNLEYIKVLECLTSTMSLLRNIQSAYTLPLEEVISLDDAYGLTEEEARSLAYCDELEQFDMMTFNQVSLRVGQGLYFNKRSNSLFLNTLELIKMNFIMLIDKQNYGLPIKYNDEHRDTVKSCIDNLNYCILNSFELFRIIDEDCIQTSVNEFCIKNNIDPVAFATEIIDYYKENRPSLPLFTKYPELLDALEDKIPSELLFRVVDLSEWIEESEMKAIIAGTLEIDENFVIELEERFKGGVDGE